TLPRPRGALSAELVGFALSHQGQQAIRDAGFLPLSIEARASDGCPDGCPARYQALTRGARRLTIDFRFRQASGEPDSRAARDLDRLVSFLSANQSQRLLLFGFADRSTDQRASARLSLDRARTVAQELERRGVKVDTVEGFGAAMPVSARD